MEVNNNKKIDLISIFRYILALPISIIVFYFVGQVLVFANSWTYIHQINTFMVFFIVLIKNIILVVTLYMILPGKKRLITTILSGVMMILSLATAYIYIINLHNSLASIYIIQIFIWIGIILFIHIKVANRKI